MGINISYVLSSKTYPVLPSQLGEINLDIEVYQAIRRSTLHRVVDRSSVIMPYAEIISWLINHTDIKKLIDYGGSSGV